MRPMACFLALLAPAACHGQSEAARMVSKVSLDGLAVEVTLPRGWKLVGDRSGEAAGMVAFAPGRYTPGAPGQEQSAFLDATRQGAAIPPSLEAATADVLAVDDCKAPAACTVRSGESLPDGGYLVSIKTPRSLFVEAWRPAPGGRAVRCGAEVSALSALKLHPRTWLDDPGEVLRVGAAIEGICRSVKTGA